MLRFAANISFLFKELPFLDRFAAAAEAGFKLVECHWPYDNPIEALRERLARMGQSLIMVNTAPGNLEAGDFGLGAVPGREADFQAALDQALSYVSALGATRIHCMAGKVPVTATAHRTFVDNLRIAADKTQGKGVTLVIEPINTRSAPGYFLTRSQQAVDIIQETGRPNVKLLFDVFHLQIMEGDIIMRLEKLLPFIGHIQIAAVPSRAEPDEGEINYRAIFDALERIGYDGVVGCEYLPRAGTRDGLAWMKKLGVSPS
ncbi:MAG TPA: 2-oxo-tetronate isomerase [Dongiaceae bacterium]|jgi:hydroxypyruvate isomerase|nr:2-oxo-tetronate isomerase [Dongiaceae bacterium]